VSGAAIDRRRLRPWRCDTLVRLGAAHDGGYVVPADTAVAASTLLSLGVKDDWSFDRAFVRHNPRVRVIAVDGGIGPARFLARGFASAFGVLGHRVVGRPREARRAARTLRTAVDYFRFFRPPHRHVRRMAAVVPGEGLVTIAELLAQAADRPHGVFVKMDVEGAEYALVPALVAHAHAIAGLVIEFHKLSRRIREFEDAMDALLGPFRIVHVHGNNYAPFDESLEFPSVVEITLVHRERLSSAALSTEPYPRQDLDRPNNPRRPDHPIRFGD
jgi:hypothetical protein